MFCPQCGTNQGDELRFCNRCGVNLYSVRQAATSRETDEKFDWSKTWVAEMFLSEGERNRRAEALERQSGVSPAKKKCADTEAQRYKEIKDGVITACSGAGVMIFLYIFMDGVIAAGVPDPASQIVGRVWIAGVIPFLVGLGLIFNGLIVSKKMVEVAKRELQRNETPKALEPFAGEDSSAPVRWSQPASPNFSVTENTTRELGGSRQAE
jgi:hypothetical protein